jgi:hypothetical protein
MNDISDAADLLATARDALTQDLLPSLPRDKRYVGLMIGNVIGIAMRELQAGSLALADEAQRSARLLEHHGAARRDDGAASDLADLRRRLCQAIRAGEFDAPPARSALMSHLARTSADWVAISNPKALRTT